MDICNVIKQWVYNDINYKSNLSKLENLFIHHNTYGETFVIKSRKPSWKDIVTHETLGLMQENTINVILNEMNKWRQLTQIAVKWKSPRQMARILYHYPLKQLILAFHEETIDGRQIMNVFKGDAVLPLKPNKNNKKTRNRFDAYDDDDVSRDAYESKNEGTEKNTFQNQFGSVATPNIKQNTKTQHKELDKPKEIKKATSNNNFNPKNNSFGNK
eukprot:970655_1